MAEVPSSHRQVNEVLVTPLVGDVLFSERKVMQAQNIPAYGTAHPNAAKWPNHKFVYARERDEPGSQSTFDFFYAADRANQDLYNFSFTQADIGGTKFDAVTRTYVTPRATWSPTSVAMGAAMPNVPEDKFPGTYVLAQRRETRIGDQALDSLYVAEELTYVKKVTLTDISYDETFGGTLKTTQTLRYRGEIIIPATTTPVAPAITIEQLIENDIDPPYWGLQSDGIAREGTQLTDNWFVVTEKQVVPEDMVEDGREYNTSVNAFWPAVLDSVAAEVWAKRGGGAQTYFVPKFKREAYRGPCAAVVFEKWSKEPPMPGDVTKLLPLPINIQTPYFSVNVGPTLHPQFTPLFFTTGTEDPVFEYAGYTYTFTGTDPHTDWPATQVVQDEVRPYRGGYMRTRVTVSSPAPPPPPPPTP